MESTHGYAYEARKLSETLTEIDRQREKLDRLPRYYGEDLVEQSLDAIREQQRTNLAIAAREPYFGRIDFQPDEAPEPTPLYIGKVGLQKADTGDVLVADWRAPVSSLFYSFTGATDTAQYVSPEGIVTGTVALKRNIVVRDRSLVRVVDSYVKGGDNLNVTDEYLLYRLGENKDHRLRDIVSTIQAEQDNIIRAPRTLSVVIQGVAGSGKTTVALHRLAYLLYQYPEKIRAEKLIIFAPNALFLDYISDVLPELGVGGIQQTTFEQWALSILEEPVKVADHSEILEQWFHPNGMTDKALVEQIRYRGSVQFARDLDAYLSGFEANMVPAADFDAGSHLSVDSATIREWFSHEYAHYPLAQRRERILSRLKRVIETEAKVRKSKGISFDRKKAMQRLKAYERLWPDCRPLEVYREAVVALGIAGPSEENTRSKRTRKVHTGYTTVRREELPALVYLHTRLRGIDSSHMFDHVVIDEAQDFSPFQVWVLKAFCPSKSFTILGDTAQNIYSLYGISDWQAFLDLFEGKSQKFTLDRSYRSTVEIIEFANSVLAEASVQETLAKPVFRSGEPVLVQTVPIREQPRVIAEMLSAWRAAGTQSAAVVTRTLAEGKRMADQLNALGMEAHLLTGQDTTYHGGISVAPVHLTKGLEFDGVIISGVSEDNYRRQSLDAKLLYVACTRAMHKLCILCGEPPSQLVRGARNTTAAAE